MSDEPVVDVSGLNHWFGMGDARKRRFGLKRKAAP